MRFTATTFAIAHIVSDFTGVCSKTLSTETVAPTKTPATVYGSSTVTVHRNVHSRNVTHAASIRGDDRSAIPTISGIEGTRSRDETRPTPKVGKPFGRNEKYFESKPDEDVKMQPCAHWNFNREDHMNIVPSDLKQLFYAEGGHMNAKPANEFYFGIIDLIFHAPAVILEHSSHIDKIEYTHNKLVIEFGSTYARDLAKESWPEGTIIVSNTADCKASSDDDQCYFKVNEVINADEEDAIIVFGNPQTRDESTKGGEARWGRYKPDKNGFGNGKQPNGVSSCHGSPSSCPNSGKYNQANSASAGIPEASTEFNNKHTSTKVHSSRSIRSGNKLKRTPTASGNEDRTDNDTKVFGNETPTCRAPPDTKYHLPTACTGSYFDLDLDEAIGVGVLSDDYLAFLQEASNDLSSDSHSKLSRRVSKFHRRGWGWWNKIWNAVKKHVIEPVVNVVKKVYKYGSAVVKGVYEIATTGAISGGGRESFNFALPDGNKASIKQVDSPWGPAALIAAYGTQSKIKADKGVQYEAYLNIYCVGCAAQGRIELAGSATWDVRKGITKGEIEVWADLKVAMKVGIDAQIKLTREWKKQLFQRGLPSLDFGFIIIGPTIRVDARVALEAGAEGRILAGAEMNWNRAYAKVDFIDPSKSTRRNFDPIGHPILEAEGSIYVGAELGLPIGLHFGITIAHWSKAVGLIDEPMIKGIAKAAARAELADGKITAGFTLTEGCKGIHASLSLRNKLVCDVLDIKEFTILDTDYKSIASMCIPIGKQTKSTADNGEISKITDDERTKSSEATDAGGSEITEKMTDNESNTATEATAEESSAIPTKTTDNESNTTTESTDGESNAVPTELSDNESSITTESTDGESSALPTPKNDEDSKEGAINGDATNEDASGRESSHNDSEEMSHEKSEEESNKEGKEKSHDDSKIESKEEDNKSHNKEDREETYRESDVESKEKDHDDGDEGSKKHIIENRRDQAMTRLLFSRQDDPDNTTSTSSNDLPDGLSDITESAKWTNEEVNYGFPNVEDDPYKRTDGYVFTKLLAGSYNVMYCSNGNMYLKYITQQADLGCDDLFAYNDDAVVGDGQGRYFYYHDDSMNAAGVSRLRLGVEESPIEGTSAVAMVPWRASATGTEPDAEVEGLYVIADFVKEDIYYMTFCTYKDQQRPKIYVVSNITSGIDVLESGDVKFSVTGGDVDRCYPLTAKEDAEEQDKWAEWDTSLDTDANGLEFELPDESNSPAA